MRCRPVVASGRAGFSLLEVVVVLAILAVIAVAAVPMLRSDADDDVAAIDAAARQVASLFRMARDSAVQNAVPVTVVLDPAEAAFWFEVEQPSTFGNTDQLDQRPGGLRGMWGILGPGPESIEATPLELPTGVWLEGAPRQIFVFRVNGSVFGDSVVLRNAMEARIIHLNPWTGDVVVR